MILTTDAQRGNTRLTRCLRILTTSSIRVMAFALMICAEAVITQSPASAQTPQAAVWGWGDSSFGQLATATNASEQKTAVATLYGNGALSISVGRAHSLVVKGDGSIWASGLNSGCPFSFPGHSPALSGGQLGDGTLIDRITPVQVSGAGPGSGFMSVAAGLCHSLGLKNDGTVWAWGSNNR